MTVEQRRKEIVKILEKEEKPVSASILAQIFGISRQVIVGDIAVIRASGIDVVSLARGYTIRKKKIFSREFKVFHSDEDVEKELSLIVKTGGIVEDVFVNHRVYGKLSARIDIKTFEDIAQFLESISSGKSSLLKNVTSGYHYHTVSAASSEVLDKIERALKENGFLAPPKNQSTIGIGESRF